MPKRSRKGLVSMPARVVAPDQGERRQIELDRTRGRPFTDHDIELVILQRWIKNFLHHRREAVNFVNEQHVIGFEIGQQCRQISRTLQHWTGSMAQADPHFPWQ